MFRLDSESSPVVALLIHVADQDAGVAWYSRAFPMAVRRTDKDGFVFLHIQGTAIEIVPADDKVSSGPAGSVVYWRVDDFNEALAHMQEQGAVLYRGPMQIEDGLRMCQVRDPWGNCIGLRGK